MKWFYLVALFFLSGCIQTDIEEPFPPTLRIDNSFSQIEFRVDGSYSLEAIYTDDTGEPSDVSVVWESSDESILSFAENTAMVHAEGLVLISARANGLRASESVETLPSRGSLQITGFTPKIQSGNSLPFHFNFIDAQGATKNDITPQWSSSDETVATVSQNGVVTSQNAGSSDITVAFDGASNVVKLEVLNDPVMVDPIVRMIHFAQFLSVGDLFEFQSNYYNENGLIDETSNIVWSSSDESIISIDNATGLATANSPGTVTIEASFQELTSSVEVEVDGDAVTERTGSLMGTGYDIEGDFTLSENDDGELILDIKGYKPDGPGPYFYLTNQSTTVNNGLNLGEARMSGDITINISEIDPSIELSTFNFLMVWCEPFSVRLGFGEFEN